MGFSRKQVQSIMEATKRYNVWCGAVSSGKTYASIYKYIDELQNGPKGDAMILGVSRSTIQRNVLNELYNFLKWPAPTSKTMEAKMFGRNVYFVGMNDEGSMRAIQGASLALAYGDEVAAWPQPCFKMLQSRLRIPGAKAFLTCNPEGPSHWFKKEFLDREGDLDIIHWTFLLDDNPALDESYKNNLKKEYTGMWYKRYILGEWAVAHGLIYDSLDETNYYELPRNNPTYYIVGIDYGTSNATAAVLIAVNPKIWPQLSVEAEYYYDSSKQGRQKTDDELATDIKRFIEYKGVTAIYVDPSAASLKLELRHRDLPVLDAKNDVLEGIRITSKFLSGKNLLIHKSCKNLIECIQSYSWDPKAADRGEDQPLKKREHICVVAETLIETDLGQLAIGSMAFDDSHGDLVNYNMCNGEMEIDSYKNVRMTRKQASVIKVTLWNGSELMATPDHQVLTEKGMMPLEWLNLMDSVIVTDAKVLNVAENKEGSIRFRKEVIKGKLKKSKVKSLEKMTRLYKVYCLGTGKNGTMVANGMIVSNCDALRYAIYSAFPTGQFNHPDESLTIEQIRRNVYGENAPMIFNQGAGGYY